MRLTEWESALGIIATVVAGAFGAWKLFIRKATLWLHKRLVMSIVTEVMRELKVKEQVDDALSAHFRPNGGKNIYDKLERIEQVQQLFVNHIQKDMQMKRAILNTQGVAFWESDHTGDCIYASPMLCALIDRSEQELIGMGWTACIHKDDAERIREAWDYALDNNTKFNEEYRFVSADNEVIDVRGVAQTLRDASGKLIGFYGTLTKI